MTHSPTAAEVAALKVAHAAAVTPDGSYDLVSTVVFALGSAQLLQSPETAAELAALRSRVAELEGPQARPSGQQYRDRFGDTWRADGDSLVLAATAAGGPVSGRAWVEPAADVARDFGPLLPIAEPSHEGPEEHTYRIPRDLPEYPRA